MHSSATLPSEDQWAILAGTRLFLALVVFFGHIDIIVHPYPYKLFGSGFFEASNAVYGFFILSGFSIAASLQQNSKGFYSRRFFRIWPLYLEAIVIGLLVNKFALGHNGVTWPITHAHFDAASPLAFIVSLFMMQNILQHVATAVGPTWSLAPEWWHYMIAPKLNKLAPPFLLAMIGISFAGFAYLLHGGTTIAAALDYGTGVLATSWFWTTGFLYFKWRGKIAGYALLILPSLLAWLIGTVIKAPLVVTIVVLIVSPMISLPRRARSISNFLGDVSYPLYLLHIPVMIAVGSTGSMHASVMIVLALAVTILSLYAVDYPCRRWAFPRLRSLRHSSTRAAS